MVILLGNRWVINSTDAYIYKDWALMPDNEVGVVLGTSKYLENGKPSPEFRGRIAAAAELYQNGKIKHLSVSGAHPDQTYHEQIGRASCRERVCQYVSISVVAIDLNTNNTHISQQTAVRLPTTTRPT